MIQTLLFLFVSIIDRVGDIILEECNIVFSGNEIDMVAYKINTGSITGVTRYRQKEEGFVKVEFESYELNPIEKHVDNNDVPDFVKDIFKARSRNEIEKLRENDKFINYEEMILV